MWDYEYEIDEFGEEGFDEEEGEEEEEEEELDPILIALGELLKRADERDHIVVPGRVREVMQAYHRIKKLFWQKNLNIEVAINRPSKTMGYIRINGAKACITATEEFADILSGATNFEIYPKLDGTFDLSLTYYGLAIPLYSLE